MSALTVQEWPSQRQFILSLSCEQGSPLCSSHPRYDILASLGPYCNIHLRAINAFVSEKASPSTADLGD